jgi:caffeoyl-CoA O-methyltransferase
MDQQTALIQYVTSLFAPEDAALQSIQSEAQKNNMPTISLDAHEAQLLQFLARAVGARRIVEIGTLAGYSGTWLARALPDDGILYTLEASPKHAQVARRSFDQAGLNGKVELIEGPAQESLRQLATKGPFDFVFIDADKESYPQYLDWAVENLRPGGMVAAHNAFRNGAVLKPQSEGDRIIDAFNRSLAAHPQLHSTLMAVGDGMAAGIKK